MSDLTVELENTTPEYLGLVRYALTFLSEDVISYEINEGARRVVIEFRPGTDVEAMRGRVGQLLQRYQQNEFGVKSVLYFDQRRKLPEIDAWTGLLERRWATPVGEGHVILRGPAAQLQALVDRKVLSMFAREFKAELEIFPSTIKSETLHRCKHAEDRKSTRLNSSHVEISYAVFCL